MTVYLFYDKLQTILHINQQIVIEKIHLLFLHHIQKDLFFVIFDEKNDEEDQMIAAHIVNMHRMLEDALKPEFSTEALQTFIKFGRSISPKFTREAAEILKEEYKRMR